MADGEKAGRLGSRLRRHRSGPRWSRLRRLRAFVVSTAGVRTIGATLVVLGLITAVALLARPVEAAFSDDVLLRYRDLGASPLDVPKADCGSALDASSRDADASSLGTLARDAACRDEGSRQLAIALASGAVIFLTGIMTLYLSSPNAASRMRAAPS